MQCSVQCTRERAPGLVELVTRWNQGKKPLQVNPSLRDQPHRYRKWHDDGSSCKEGPSGTSGRGAIPFATDATPTATHWPAPSTRRLPVHPQSMSTQRAWRCGEQLSRRVGVYALGSSAERAASGAAAPTADGQPVMVANSIHLSDRHQRSAAQPWSPLQKGS